MTNLTRKLGDYNLSDLNFKETQNDILANHTPGTGKWQLESQAFKDWVVGKSKILWWLPEFVRLLPRNDHRCDCDLIQCLYSRCWKYHPHVSAWNYGISKLKVFNGAYQFDRGRLSTIHLWERECRSSVHLLQLQRTDKADSFLTRCQCVETAGQRPGCGFRRNQEVQGTLRPSEDPTKTPRPSNGIVIGDWDVLAGLYCCWCTDECLEYDQGNLIRTLWSLADVNLMVTSRPLPSIKQ